jgi:hypothetical protein
VCGCRVCAQALLGEMWAGQLMLIDMAKLNFTYNLFKYRILHTGQRLLAPGSLLAQAPAEQLYTHSAPSTSLLYLC